MKMVNVLTIGQFIAYLEQVKALYGEETTVGIADTNGSGDSYALAGGGIAIDQMAGHNLATIYATKILTGHPTPYEATANLRFPALVIKKKTDKLGD